MVQPLGVVLPTVWDQHEVHPAFALRPGEYGVELIRGEGLFWIESGHGRFRTEYTDAARRDSRSAS
ncbi:MAG: hypothetical protein DPW13_08650 [Planctomycetes bacterium]|nr:hypothetical protein [Planctomycetota bacterium]